MSCQNFRTEIEEQDRQTPLGASAAAHIAVCGACRAFMAEHESLRSLVAGLARVDAPSDFEFRLRARIARAGDAHETNFARRRFVPGTAWLTVASCAVLVLAGFVIFRQARRQSPASTPAETVATKSTPTMSPQATAMTDKRDMADVSAKPDVNVVTHPRSTNRLQKDLSRREKIVLSPETMQQIAVNQAKVNALDTNNLSVQGTKIYSGAPIPLPMTTPDRPLEAMFKDAHGASRVVSVDPVTFGSRLSPSQRTRMANVSYTQGVW